MKGKFTCVSCGVSTKKIKEYYMVKDEVWNLANAGDVILCIGCLEEKIGRMLNYSDFTDCPVNDFFTGFRKSDRLINRLLRNVK